MKEILDSESMCDEDEEDFDSIFSNIIMKNNDGEISPRARAMTIEDRASMRGGSVIARGKSANQHEKITLEDFEILIVLGRGAFGKVFLARLQKDKQLYAIKTLRKDMLLEKDAVTNTQLEKEIMLDVDNPFLINMIYLL